jgi:hypothetical protein
VLEINSGVMMENFAASNPENYEIAKNIYQKAILQSYRSRADLENAADSIPR